MKLLRVPWIQCRADEASAHPHDVEWRGRRFRILAYSETEAREWWRDLPQNERENALGIRSTPDEEPGLF